MQNSGTSATRFNFLAMCKALSVAEPLAQQVGDLVTTSAKLVLLLCSTGPQLAQRITELSASRSTRACALQAAACVQEHPRTSEVLQDRWAAFRCVLMPASWCDPNQALAAAIGCMCCSAWWRYNGDRALPMTEPTGPGRDQQLT